MEDEKEEEDLIVAYLAPSSNGQSDNERSNIGKNVLLGRGLALLLLCRRPVVLRTPFFDKCTLLGLEDTLLGWFAETSMIPPHVA